MANRLTPEIAALFDTGARLVHLVTLRSDGRPHVTVVWTGVENGEIVIAHLSEHQKVKNVRRDPRVALSMATGERNARGLDEYLVVEGTATITEGGAVDLLQTLVKRYVGPEAPQVRPLATSRVLRSRRSVACTGMADRRNDKAIIVIISAHKDRKPIEGRRSGVFR